MAAKSPEGRRATYYRWRKEFGGLKTDQVRRMKDLEVENHRLRKAIEVTYSRIYSILDASGLMQDPRRAIAAGEVEKS
jgi:putative transposase